MPSIMTIAAGERTCGKRRGFAMLIEEITRSCVHEGVAQVAVMCIGRQFYAEIERAAQTYDMTPGAFAALSVKRFARVRDDAEIRAVKASMKGAQEPVLAGLHRILCIMLAAGVPSDRRLHTDDASSALGVAEMKKLEMPARRSECCCY